MNRLFSVGRLFPIPDGTRVGPFLNPFDVNEKELPLSVFSGMSIAAGELDPRAESRIHFHPIVAQVTWVIEGQLVVKMKEEGQEDAYRLDVNPQEAVLMKPCTFFQLINPSSTSVVRVLYIVSPAYVFDKDKSKVRYDDARVLKETWDELGRHDWKVRPPVNLAVVEQQRRNAIDRIAKRKSEAVARQRVHTKK